MLMTSSHGCYAQMTGIILEECPGKCPWEKIFGGVYVPVMYGKAYEGMSDPSAAIMIYDTLINTYIDTHIAINRLYC